MEPAAPEGGVDAFTNAIADAPNIELRDTSHELC
jgi:hypothetical protein